MRNKPYEASKSHHEHQSAVYKDQVLPLVIKVSDEDCCKLDPEDVSDVCACGPGAYDETTVLLREPVPKHVDVGWPQNRGE